MSAEASTAPLELPEPPEGLGERGSALWSAVVERCVLAAEELQLLTEACRTADDAERLAEALEGEPATVPGSAGQPVAHPLGSELRATRQLLARLLAQLDLPAELDGDDGDGSPWDGLSASQRARKAARARWDRRTP